MATAATNHNGTGLTTQEPSKKRKPAKLSRLHRPDNMPLEDWQRELRRQFGREQQFTLKNIGNEPVFSEFQVTNPRSAQHGP